MAAWALDLDWLPLSFTPDEMRELIGARVTPPEDDDKPAWAGRSNFCNVTLLQQQLHKIQQNTMIAMKHVRAAALVALLAATCVKATTAAPVTDPKECVFKREKDAPELESIWSYIEGNVDTVSCVSAMNEKFLTGLNVVSDASFEALLVVMFMANTLKHVPTPALSALDEAFCKRFAVVHTSATLPGKSTSEPSVLLVARMTDDQVKALPPKCVQVEEVLNAMKPSQIRSLTLASTTEWTALHANKNLLRNIGWEQFQAWVGTEFENCKEFDAKTDLTELSSEVLVKMDSRCLSIAKDAANLDKSESKTLLRSLQPESISRLPATGFPKEFACLLTPNFLKSVDSAATDASSQCEKFPLDRMNYHLVGSLSKQCAVNSFKKTMDKIDSNMPRFLHNDFFSSFGELGDFVKVANSKPDLYANLKSEHYADLVKDETFCRDLDLKSSPHGLRLPEVITPECFAKAKQPVQELLLKNYVLKLPINILSTLESIDDKLFDIFKEVAATRPELLGQIAPNKAEGDSAHPCTSLNVDKFKVKGTKKLAAALPTTCLKSLSGLGDIKAKDLGLLPDGLLAIIDLQAVINKAVEVDDWKAFTLPEWSAFLANPKLCALVPEDRVANVPMGQMTNPECLVALKPKFAKDQLHNLRADFLKSLPQTVADKFRPLLTATQQQNLPQPPKPAAPLAPPVVAPAKPASS